MFSSFFHSWVIYFDIEHFCNILISVSLLFENNLISTNWALHAVWSWWAKLISLSCSLSLWLFLMNLFAWILSPLNEILYLWLVTRNAKNYLAKDSISLLGLWMSLLVISFSRFWIMLCINFRYKPYSNFILNCSCYLQVYLLLASSFPSIF